MDRVVNVDARLEGKLRVRTSLLRNRALVCPLVLIAVNAICLTRLFAAEILDGEDGSAPLVAITRWLRDGLALDGWIPAWYGGIRARRLGALGMPWAASILSKFFHWTPQHAFHSLGALVCCLLPVAFFLLLLRLSDWTLAFPAALLSSLVSVSALVPAQYALIKNGNGPHILGTLLALVFVWLLHRIETERKASAILFAPAAFACVLVTDLLCVDSLVILLVVYRMAARPKCLSKAVITLAGVSLLGGLLAYPRFDIDGLLLERSNLIAMNGSLLSHSSFYGLVFIIAGILGLEYLFNRMGAAPLLRAIAFCCLIFGTIVGGSRLFTWTLIPNAAPLALEFNLSACALVAYVARELCRRATGRQVTFALAVGLSLVAIQLFSLRTHAKSMFRAVDVTHTTQYRVAEWLRQNAGGRRVFAVGKVGAWLNVFTDTPQMTGCCEERTPAQVYRAANWAILSGQNAGDQEVSNSIKWLQTFGVSYVVMDNDYAKPHKFEGVLPRVFQYQDAAVYALPNASQSIAHTISGKDIVRYLPEGGTDLLTVNDYVSAINKPGAKLAVEWFNSAHGHIDAEIALGQKLSIQINQDPGWHAQVNGRSRSVGADALGMIVIDPQCTGRCSVDLEWASLTRSLLWRVLWVLAVGALFTGLVVWIRKPDAIYPITVHRRWLAATTIALLCGLFLVLLIRSAWVAEDAYISLRVTDNILAGYGPRWNIDERVQVYTDPLFSAVVTAVSWGLKDVYVTSIVVSIVFTAAALFFLLRGATAPGFAISVVALFFSKGFVDFSVSGMENPATHCFLAAYLFVYFRKRDPFLLSLCAALVALNREDSLLLLLPSLVFFCASVGAKAWKRVLLGWSPFIAWLGFATFYYGFPFPNTAYAKLHTGIPFISLFTRGLAYYANAWHLDTATVVVLVVGTVMACVVGEWVIAAGIVLDLIYVASVGGDYMTSRFLTGAFVVGVAVIAQYWQMKPAITLAAAATIVAAGITIPAPTLTSARSTFGQPWPVEPATGVADERAYAFPCAGFLRMGKPGPPWPGHLVRSDNPYWYSCQGPPTDGDSEPIWPDAFLSRAGRSWRAAGVRVFVIPNVGMAGYFAGPGVHLIDDMGLGDALLARLPMIPSKTIRAGHYRRTVPAGYVETVTSGTNQLKDTDLHEYYDHLYTVIAGELTDASRLKEIYMFNLGRYDYLIDNYSRKIAAK